MMNLYEIMNKWTTNLDNKIDNEYKEQVIDNETPELMNVTKKSTKEFSKNYQKVFKELTTENEIIMDNNNKNQEIIYKDPERVQVENNFRRRKEEKQK